MKTGVAIFLTLTFVVYFSACDSFSLKESLTLSGEASLRLIPSKKVLLQNELISLSITDGAGPYLFSVSAAELYEGTKTEPLGTIASGWVPESDFTSGSAIGRLRLSVENAAGATGETYVTVIPPAPAAPISATKNVVESTMTVTLTLVLYEAPGAAEYLVLEYKAQSDSVYQTLVTGISPTAPTVMTGPIPVALTNFRVYAASGSFRSEPGPNFVYNPNANP